MSTLHIFVDESGDFDFLPSKSRFFLFGIAWTYNPVPLAAHLQALRFRYLKEGHDLFRFHACEDKWEVRRSVLSLLQSHADWHFAAMVVEKSKVNPAIRKPMEFYYRFASIPLRFVLRSRAVNQAHKIIIHMDQFPSQIEKTTTSTKIRSTIKRAIDEHFRKRKLAAESTIKEILFESLEDLEYHFYHHPSASNYWLQVVDYALWAVQRKWENNDASCYELIRPRMMASELEIFDLSKKHYYVHRKAPTATS